MSFRYDHKGKPVGLDWSVCNDGSARPDVWRMAGLRPNEPKVRADLEQAAERTGNAEGHAARQRLSRAIERKVINMYVDDEMSALQIGREIGIQAATVFKVLKRNHVPTRSRSEGMRLSRARRAVA